MLVSSISPEITSSGPLQLILRNLLRCPFCGNDLSVRPDGIVCKLGHCFPYRQNVLDFSSVEKSDHIQDRSERSFGVEWTRYYATLGWEPDALIYEKEKFLTYTRAMPSFFSGKIVLDAGCGNGRYINVVNNLSSPPPRCIIGVDVSDSIFVAAKNCSGFENVVFIKANLNVLPKILKKSMDYIYSVGVLHHTPNAERSFGNLAKCVGPGGFVSLFIYGKGNRLLHRVNTFLRNRLFQGWSPRLIYAVCVMIAIPMQICRMKVLGPWILECINRLIFVSPDVHNMFDAYSAGYTSFHDKPEVERWYRKNGFDCVIDSQLNHTALFCIGRKTDGAYE